MFIMVVFLLCYVHNAEAAGGIFDRTKYYSPVDYGAKANDNIDDSDAFQKCLNEAKKKNGAKIIIPQGMFIIAKELRLDETCNLIIEGCGTTLVKPMNNWTNIFYGNYNKQITIKDISFEGNRSDAFDEQWPHRMNACAILGKSSGIRFENCLVKDFHYGVCFGTSTENGYDIWVVNNQFINCKSDIDLYGKPAVHIVGNSSHNCTGNAIQIEPPYTRKEGFFDYKDQPQIDALSVGNIVSENVIEGCEGVGIIIFGGSENITVCNNQIINFGSTGILTHDGASNLIIRDNIISNSKHVHSNNRPWTSSGAGIMVAKVYNINVSANLISHANTGIYVAGATGALLSNNKVADSKDAGICLYNASQCLLNANQIYNYNLSRSWWASSGIVFYHSKDITVCESVITDTVGNDYSVFSLESERIKISNTTGTGYKKSLTFPANLSD
jgi:parallel beta-helix repeat protein